MLARISIIRCIPLGSRAFNAFTKEGIYKPMTSTIQSRINPKVLGARIPFNRL
ncbi:hypothetical protein D3C74_474080 [compost metagenome]